MNEISRVLKPGGIFIAVTPAFPSSASFQDPTHINIISEETLSYFDEKAWATELGYGYSGKLERLHQSWLRGSAPYLGRTSINIKKEGFIGTRFGRYNHALKILNRIMRLVTISKPYSLLWILRKPCLLDD